VEDDVDVWRYAIVSCMPQTTTCAHVQCTVYASVNTKLRCKELSRLHLVHDEKLTFAKPAGSVV